MKILNIVGARPNFMKIAPIVEAMEAEKDSMTSLLIHTGQHYDKKMSKDFFDDLGIPKPDINLGVGSGTHAQQTAKIMVAFEKVCLEQKPDLVLVVGDVNSTMACAITAKKLHTKVAHVEAGLRSRDMSMPEEINRLCTDAIADYLFTTDTMADENLTNEGVSKEKIFFVGNVMIDTLLKHKQLASENHYAEKLGLKNGKYALLTMHRPSNVDDRDTLEGILEGLLHISAKIPIIFPIHPRTKNRAEEFGLSHYFNTSNSPNGIWITQPIGYLEFLNLTMNAKLLLTDSGGIQEETTVLGIPCITLRHNTERPITCTQGTNTIVGNKKQRIIDAAMNVINGKAPTGRIPEKWDGKAAKRIVTTLKNSIQNK